FSSSDECPEDLLGFYHPETLKQIASLKHYLINRRNNGALDSVDDWICLLALNRLTGHSPGFFSVYTLPPNLAVSVKSQRKINEKRNQTPPRRDLSAIILKKSRQLLQDCDAAARRNLANLAGETLLLTRPAAKTSKLPSNSVSLVVTSPPFLDVVDYATDNWLRCWFNGINEAKIDIWTFRKPEEWTVAMERVFGELRRVLKPGGYIAFEVGEVRRGKLKMEELVIPAAKAAKLSPVLVLINSQEFTKTSNCWGVTNQIAGTNTNRVILLQKLG